MLTIYQENQVNYNNIDFVYSKKIKDLNYAEFNTTGKVEFITNGALKVHANLTLDEFKALIPDYDYIIEESKLYELNQYRENRYKLINKELIEITEPSLEYIKKHLINKLHVFKEECKYITLFKTVNQSDFRQIAISDLKDREHRGVNLVGSIADGYATIKSKVLFDNYLTDLLNKKIKHMKYQQIAADEPFFYFNGVIKLTLGETKKIFTQANNILQENYYVHLDHVDIINASDNLNLEYNYKQGFLHNQEIRI